MNEGERVRNEAGSGARIGMSVDQSKGFGFCFSVDGKALQSSGQRETWSDMFLKNHFAARRTDAIERQEKTRAKNYEDDKPVSGISQIMEVMGSIQTCDNFHGRINGTF